MTAQRPVAAIVYLDADDEITSAATRIRMVGERRLAIVLPSGSRVSTSRMNFRLLAREAETRGRELAIVAPEAATRALAASAGLPVFGSVAEYEDALTRAGAEPTDDDDDGASWSDDDGDPAESAADGPGDTGANGTPESASAAGPDDGPGDIRGWWARDVVDNPAPRPAAGVRVTGNPRVSTAGTGSAGTAPAGGTRRLGRPIAATPSAPDRIPGAGGAAGAERSGVRARTAVTDTVLLPPPDVIEEPRRRRMSGLVLALVSIVIVLLAASGVAGWIFLPSATVTVAARVDPVGPLQLTVRADPLEVSGDVAQGIVPAAVVTFDLAASQDFPATGKKVTETKAGGSVQWTNCDPTRAYTIPASTIARTSGGEQFSTTDAVFLPVAILSGNPPTIACQSRTVGVNARASGTEGNVGAATITVVPSNFNSVVIRVTNPAATSGGTHTEAKVVVQKDVDAAVATLGKAIRDQFATELADPAHAPPGLTMFAATRSMSSTEPTVDPATLVGTIAPTFTLGATATGTATAVDPSLVRSLGEQRIRSAVETGKSLVRDSVEVTVGQPHVDGSAIVFPVTAAARQVDAPDAVTIRKMVKGLSVDEAREALRNYGDATVDVWPGWVTTITSYDFRLNVRVVSDVPTEPTIPLPSSSPGSAPSVVPGGSVTPGSAGPSSAPSVGPSGSAVPGASGSVRPRVTLPPIDASAAPSGT